ncbi:MAG: protein arginine kinase [Anaerocolumna sp.]
MHKWYKDTGKNQDVVISSRVRLARNLKSYPFSAKLKDEEAALLVEDVRGASPILEVKVSKKFYSCNVDALSESEQTAMMERHIISPLLIAKEQRTGLILSDDEKISIMINEEDHIRIQSITGGMNIAEAFEGANFADDITNELFHYAFHEKYGYLSSCPTNVGTGLRASYMMFLPALTVAGKIVKLSEELGKYGITLRGTYGEASKSLGSLYQISNQKTLGGTEKDIIEGLNRIVEQVMKQERRQREYIITHSYDEFEDKVHRSYGVLKYAKQLSSADAMTLLAQIKLGNDMELIKFGKVYNIHELMMEIQPGNLQCLLDNSLASAKRDKFRADYIRKKLPDLV